MIPIARVAKQISFISLPAIRPRNRTMRTSMQSVAGVCRCSSGIKSRGPTAGQFVVSLRPFSTTQSKKDDVVSTGATSATSAASDAVALDPNTVQNRREERRLLRTGVAPIGSRRRRAVLAGSQGSRRIAFEQLPYQCFQEARKILQADRQDKIAQIETQRGRIERLQSQDVSGQGEHATRTREMRLSSMRKYLEELKILADVNDPLVKKRFEDGQGDMSKPIYRHLAKKKWESRSRLITLQRVTQMSVVPDVLQTVDPTAHVSFSFARKSYPPGEFVPSGASEQAPKLGVQVFDKGERLVTVAVVDSDVPNVQKDGFDYQCHFLACNIPLSPTLNTVLDLGKMPKEVQTVQSWLPPFAQKGSPYHRLSIFVLEQKAGQQIDADKVKEKLGDGKQFVLRSFVDRHGVKPIGVSMFRTQWDEGTDSLMQRLGFAGAGDELKRKRVEPLPYKWKPKDGKRYR